MAALFLICLKTPNYTDSMETLIQVSKLCGTALGCAYVDAEMEADFLRQALYDIWDVVRPIIWTEKLKENLSAMKQGEVAKLTIGNDIYAIIAMQKGGLR